ncbi:MAG: class I tRNA ligase family protein, partial [Cyanobacteria bacterium P01_H01_bin.152]
CQTVLAIVIENLARAIAPVLSHMAEDIWQNLPYEAPTQSVFESGWVKLEDTWRQPELAEKWAQLRDVRQEVNKVLEQARSEKAIGSSLEAKALLYLADTGLHQTLDAMNPTDAIAPGSVHVDELRYLFLVSQVEVLDTPEKLTVAKYRSEADHIGVGVVDAEGEKCDRCWYYSSSVGQSSEHPAICDRCVEALSGNF